MGLNHYCCCNEMIGDPHAPRCGGTPRYPLGREREAADRYARKLSEAHEDQLRREGR